MSRPLIEGRRAKTERTSINFKPEILTDLKRVAYSRLLYLNEFIEFLFLFYLKHQDKEECTEPEAQEPDSFKPNGELK